MGQANRRGTYEQRRDKAMAERIITRGYMKLGADNDQGTWRGWRIHAEPAEDREPVTIVRGH